LIGSHISLRSKRIPVYPGGENKPGTTPALPRGLFRRMKTQRVKIGERSRNENFLCQNRRYSSLRDNPIAPGPVHTMSNFVLRQGAPGSFEGSVYRHT
jgi:hypothetical protein